MDGADINSGTGLPEKQRGAAAAPSINSHVGMHSSREAATDRALLRSRGSRMAEPRLGRGTLLGRARTGRANST